MIEARATREDTVIGFVFGAAVGYVLGAKAGRQRYEQIVRVYHRVSEHPAMQSAAGVAKEKVVEAVKAGKQAAKNRSSGADDHDDPVLNGSRTNVSTIPRA